MNNKFKIIIFGATSAIAQAAARQLSNDGHHLFLIARNKQKLDTLVSDLKARTQKEFGSMTVDLNDMNKHEEMIQTAKDYLGGIDVVLIAQGILPNQKACQDSYDLTHETFTTNCLSVVSLLTYISNILENQKNGCIAVISSVAGDRGRQSNYVYGTSKAAINTFLQGLRNRLRKSNVNVLTIKPGFVDTPMTKDLKKGGPLWAQPERVAKDIVKAIYKNKPSIIYTPKFWRYIMLIIKTIPERIFIRLSL